MQAIQFYIESTKKAETISYYNNKCNKKTTQNTLKNRLDIQTVFLVGLEYTKSYQIKVITKLPNSEQSYKGKVKTHNYINRQNQSTTGKL